MQCETCESLNQAVEAALERLKKSIALVGAADPASPALIESVEKQRREYAEARQQLEAHLKTHG